MSDIKSKQLDETAAMSEKELAATEQSTEIVENTFPVNVQETDNTNSTITVASGNLYEWRLQEGDIAVISGGTPDGVYEAKQIVSSDTFEVKGSIPDSQGEGDITIYHKAAAKKIGVDDTQIADISANTIQAALNDLSTQVVFGANSQIAENDSVVSTKNTEWKDVLSLTTQNIDGKYKVSYETILQNIDGAQGELRLYDESNDQVIREESQIGPSESITNQESIDGATKTPNLYYPDVTGGSADVFYIDNNDEFHFINGDDPLSYARFEGQSKWRFHTIDLPNATSTSTNRRSIDFKVNNRGNIEDDTIEFVYWNSNDELIYTGEVSIGEPSFNNTVVQSSIDTGQEVQFFKHNDNIHIISVHLNASGEYVINYYSDQSGNFQLESNVVTTTTTISTFDATLEESADRFHVCFNANYAVGDESGFSTESISNEMTAIELDSGGTVNMAGVTSGTLYHIVGNSGSFVTDNYSPADGITDLVIDENDVLYFVANPSTTDGYATIIRKDGGGFGTEEIVTSEGYETNLSGVPTLEIDNNGRLVYQSNMTVSIREEGQLFENFYWDSGSAGISSSSSFEPKLDIDSNKDVHLLYPDANGDLVYSKFATNTDPQNTKNLGSIQASEVILSAHSYSESSEYDIKVTSDDQVHIAYQNGQDVNVQSGTAGNFTFDNVDSLSEAPSPISLDVDSNDNLHLGYTEGVQVLYATGEVNNWTYSTLASNSIFTTLQQFYLDIDINDNVFISYVVDEDTVEFAELRALIDTGSGFGSATTIHTAQSDDHFIYLAGAEAYDEDVNYLFVDIHLNSTTPAYALYRYYSLNSGQSTKIIQRGDGDSVQRDTFKNAILKDVDENGIMYTGHYLTRYAAFADENYRKPPTSSWNLKEEIFNNMVVEDGYRFFIEEDGSDLFIKRKKQWNKFIPSGNDVQKKYRKNTITYTSTSSVLEESIASKFTEYYSSEFNPERGDNYGNNASIREDDSIDIINRASGDKALNTSIDRGGSIDLFYLSKKANDGGEIDLSTEDMVPMEKVEEQSSIPAFDQRNTDNNGVRWGYDIWNNDWTTDEEGNPHGFIIFHWGGDSASEELVHIYRDSNKNWNANPVVTLDPSSSTNLEEMDPNKGARLLPKNNGTIFLIVEVDGSTQVYKKSKDSNTFSNLRGIGDEYDFDIYRETDQDVYWWSFDSSDGTNSYWRIESNTGEYDEVIKDDSNPFQGFFIDAFGEVWANGNAYNWHGYEGLTKIRSYSTGLPLTSLGDIQDISTTNVLGTFREIADEYIRRISPSISERKVDVSNFEIIEFNNESRTLKLQMKTRKAGYKQEARDSRIHIFKSEN